MSGTQQSGESPKELKEAHIRLATASDAARIGSVARASFFATFAAVTPEDDMKTFLETTYTTENHTKEILDPAMVTFVGEVRGEVVAFAQLNLSTHEDCVRGVGPKPVELQRIYALPQNIGLGFGTLLMERCIGEAKRLGYETLWLGVWENNLRALKFYSKFGFVPVGEHFFIVGHDKQRDLILSRPL